MRGDENRVNARNQENLVRRTDSPSFAHSLGPFPDSLSAPASALMLAPKGGSLNLTHKHLFSFAHPNTHTHKGMHHMQVATTCQHVWNARG